MSKINYHQGLQLKKIIDRDHVNISKLSKKTAIPRSSIYELFEKEEIKMADLQKICDYLKLDIRSFYPDLVGTIAEEPEISYEVLKNRKYLMRC